ncbi:rhodanese [Flavivirga aquatica]|uniref:Rhodanese n=1 Tax=Flavivirga aquatica TaxID=1849968 RepID=A0A1E5T922_9FLAO|nr:rhodanese-like domain-containing protein [Flavivirga aquatica]OEK07873.1 rhodanese [Flavivirga aquatica]
MKLLLFFTSVLLFTQLQAQETLDDLLNKYNNNKIPYITAQELATPKIKAILLDAREANEYKVSHLKDAVFVGYDHFKVKNIKKQIQKKDTLIVVYCSLGIRSETISHKLKKAGYTNVKNLYGGIFEWKNNGFSVYNEKEKATDSIHTFSYEWSKWLKAGKKVYPKNNINE